MRNTASGASQRCAIAAVLTLLAAAPSSAQLHSVMLSVPSHAEEALTWCGPATAQMIMEGYPSGACTLSQADTWLAVLADKAEAMWDTDPQGLRGAMMGLCPPGSGSWVVHARSDSDDLMFSVAFWMTHNSYPAGLLLDTQSHNSYTAHKEHWVVVKGIVTDADPTPTSTVNLEYIWITDPAVPLGDPPLERYIAGATFYAELQPVNKPASTYNGKYVAVIEPPQRRGRLHVRPEILTGRPILLPDVLRHVRRWIDELKLAEIGPFEGLRGARPMDPLLVNARRGGYYLVPFALDGKTASLAILVNAYTGGFQEVVAFAPHRRINREQAVKLASPALKLEPSARATAFLIAGPGVAPRYAPAWRVESKRGAVLVQPDGVVHRIRRILTRQ